MCVGRHKLNAVMFQLPEYSVRPPVVGSPVDVRWVDGSLYKAVFKGINDTSSVEVWLLQLTLTTQLTVCY